MAEVVLAAEVGRPTGSRAVRRLRREGKIPAVIYGHGTDPLPVAIVARELRVALNSEAGANQLLSLDTGSGTYLALAREMQRHPVAQTVTHVDFVIVRRDEVISADVPIVLVGEAIEVHHGDGLVDQQMFTLAINALPTAIPSAIEADISELIIGGQVRVSDLALPTGVTTDIDPETRGRHRAAAASHRRRRERPKARAKRVPRQPPVASRPGTRRPRRAAKRARPCAAPLPGPSAGGPRRTCWSSGWETPERNSPGACTTPGPTPSSCWPQRHGASLRAEKGVQARAAVVTMAGQRVVLAVPTTYMNESGSSVRTLATRFGIDEPTSIVIVHDELDLPPGTVRLKAGGGLAGHNGLRSVQSHLHSSDFLRVRIGVGKPPSAAQGASHVLRRPPRRCVSSWRASVETAADAVERIAADGMDAAMQWCHSLPT